jgi:hypothetical protein
MAGPLLQGTDVEDDGLEAEGVVQTRSAASEALHQDLIPKGKESKTAFASREAALLVIFMTEEGLSCGDQFMAVKAFLGAIFEPTAYKSNPDSCKLPDSNLVIEWVHGYR